MGFLLVLQPLPMGIPVEEMDFKWSPFGVQAHGIPMAKLTRHNGEIIGRRIGNLIGVEALHDGLLLDRSFLRIRVEVDVTKPLPLGRLGHDNSSCKFVSREEGKNSGYGPALQTSRASKLNTPLKEVRQWVDMAEERVRNLVSHRQGKEQREDVCTVARKDTTRTTDLAVADQENRDQALRQDVVSDSGKGKGSGDVSVLIDEVIGVHDSLSQLGAMDSILSCTKAATTPPPGKVILSTAQSSGGLRPKYFVTEPTDNNLIVRHSFSCRSGTGPTLEIGIEELSPNSSPANLSFMDQALDKSMATFFQDLSIKRKAHDELRDEGPPKRIKMTKFCVERECLAVVPDKKGKGPRNDKGRIYSKIRNFGRVQQHELTAGLGTHMEEEVTDGALV
ncbi:hypothetical protein ACSBR2_032277 [Camellia fascicularis]